ncbi:MAG: UDPGP type 1 family protein [Planctomycetota bacterium]
MSEDLRALEIDLRQRCRACGQDHVFAFWDELSPPQRERFLKQLGEVDLPLVTRLASEVIHGAAPAAYQRLEPAPFLRLPGSPHERAAARDAGEALLSAGKVAAFVVAGGQGSRLGFEGPKGTFPVGPVSNRTLFQVHAEKVLALSRRHRSRIPLLILTSAVNHDVTIAFFEQHHHFGLDARDVHYFSQEMLPAVDQRGRMILAEKDSLFLSPNGHGGALLALRRSGVLDELTARGIDHIFYFQVDNPLVNVLDPVFLGHHARAAAEMSSKVVLKRDAHEKVGVLAFIDGKLGVIEYSDLRDGDQQARLPNGELEFAAGSIAIHVLDVAFVARLTAGGDLKLPFHHALKKISCIDQAGQRCHPAVPNGVKFETFVFDALRFARHSITMEVAREEEFSPVKNADGADSPLTARRDMSRQWAGWLRAAGFTVADDAAIEVSPLFAVDREELLTKLSGRGTIVHRRLWIE